MDDGAVKLSVSGFCKMVACFKPGVTLKEVRGVKNTVAG